MKVKCFPSLCEGQVNIPPSKSMAHRAIICASLAKGTSTLTNVSYSKDIIATIEAMKCIGATIVQKEDILIITGTSQITSSQKEIFCNESGSTLRFLIPIFSLCNQELTFTGAGRLMERPQTIYQDLFQDKSDSRIITAWFLLNKARRKSSRSGFIAIMSESSAEKRCSCSSHAGFDASI